MRLLLVSPLPPAPSGVADFSAGLAAALRNRMEVDAVEAPSRDALAAAGRRLYQIGNNGLHCAAYEAALEFPGVVELHDAVLHHFFLGRLNREQYIEEMVYNEGEWARSEAEGLWDRRSHAEVDEAYFKRPLLRRIVVSAEAVIVHNPAAYQAARQAGGAEKRIVEIPHFIDPPAAVEDAERGDARRDLGVSDEEVLVSCFGFQRPTKRLRTVLRVAARLGAPVRILIAGRFGSADYEASLTSLMEEAGAIRVPWVPEAEFRRLAAATDVCVNLRYPAAGETSGIAMRLMAMARPTILTAGPETSRFPDSAAVQIDSGEAEEAMLAESLKLLVEHSELRLAMGEAARNHLLENHGIERVLPAYLDVLT